MKKIINLFEQSKAKNFIRIIVSDEKTHMHHIKNSSIANKLTLKMQDHAALFEYLKNNETTSVEVVVKSKIMSCKSITYKNFTSQNICSLAKHSLQNKKNLINTVFFSDKNKPQTELCEAFLNEEQNEIIKKLFKIKNPLRCTTIWPSWVISSYFSAFPEDKNKFACSIFVLEQENYLEIICHNSLGLLSYRQDAISKPQQKIEIENTVKYLSQIHKIHPQDIAIYILNDEIINTFSTYSTTNMTMFSDIIAPDIFPAKNNIRKIANFCIVATCSLFSFDIFSKCIEATTLTKQITAEKNAISFIPLQIRNEKYLWENVDTKDTKVYSFKEAIENTGCNRLKSLAITADYDTGSLAIDFTPQDL